MFSRIVSFQELVQAVKDDLGFENLTNQTPKIRRFIQRIEKDLGWGSTTILKKKKYSFELGNIISYGNQIRIQLPSDLVALEEDGMTEYGLRPQDYTIQGNYMFFSKHYPIKKFTFLYYALLCDGEGNPVITENHFEAVRAGVSLYLYKPLVFKKKGHMSLLQYLDRDYEERLGEAKGRDGMPSTDAEFAQIATMLRMSSRDTRLYLSRNKCN